LWAAEARCFAREQNLKSDRRVADGYSKIAWVAV
jgi:hypothetical protein